MGLRACPEQVGLATMAIRRARMRATTALIAVLLPAFTTSALLANDDAADQDVVHALLQEVDDLMRGGAATRARGR